MNRVITYNHGFLLKVVLSAVSDENNALIICINNLFYVLCDRKNRAYSLFVTNNYLRQMKIFLYLKQL
jgi:hypothetical protein